MLAAGGGAGEEEAAGAGCADAEAMADRVTAGTGGVGKSCPGCVTAFLVEGSELVTGAESILAAALGCAAAGVAAGSLETGGGAAAAGTEDTASRVATGEGAAPPRSTVIRFE